MKPKTLVSLMLLAAFAALVGTAAAKLNYHHGLNVLQQSATSSELGNDAEIFFPKSLLSEVDVYYVPRIKGEATGLYYPRERKIFVDLNFDDGTPREFPRVVKTFGHELGHHFWFWMVKSNRLD